jgi:hypothetical protein
MENLWWELYDVAQADPMPEIITHMISAKWQHRHRIPSDMPNPARCSCCRFRSRRRTQVNTMVPIERLENQRHRIGPAAAK